jgi:hypothetical protein
MSDMKINRHQERALRLADRNGAVFAGGGNEISRGGLCSVPASTIRGLIARGWLEHVRHDGLAGSLTEAGRAALASLDARLGC